MGFIVFVGIRIRKTKKDWIIGLARVVNWQCEYSPLFVILWIYSAKPRPLGAVSAAFLIGYGTFRFAAEFFREPDDFLGLLALHLSMGQWLSAPMIAVGIAMFAWAWRRPQKV